jgi:hypothetical protein
MVLQVGEGAAEYNDSLLASFEMGRVYVNLRLDTRQAGRI